MIVPSFTFAASAEVMPCMGAIPVFAEIESNSFNLNPEKLPLHLQPEKKPDLMLLGSLVLAFSVQPANYTAIKTFAHDNKLWLVDDAAQSFGATLNGQPVGQLADVTCTSFFPRKATWRIW